MPPTRLCTLTAERQTVDDLLYFTPAGNAPTTQTTKVHTGSYSYRVVNLGEAFGRAIGSQSAIRLGYWLNHAGPGGTGRPNLFVVGTGVDWDESPLIRVVWDGSTGNLDVVRAAGTGSNDFETLASVAAPATLIATDTWIHLGFTYYSHATDGFLTMYVNGAEVLSLTGDTQLARWLLSGTHQQILSTTFNQFYIAGRVHTTETAWAGGSVYVDDIYVDNYDGEVDTPVPTRRFFERIFNVAGNDADFTPLSSTNVSNIDDGQPNGGANDGDTSYNRAESAGLRDTYGFDDVSVPAGYRIVGLLPYVHCKTLDVGPEISLHLWDGIQYADGASQTPPLDYTIEVFERFDSMPDGSAFSEAGVNGLEAGYQSTGAFA